MRAPTATPATARPGGCSATRCRDQAHRYDEETPLEETVTAFADLVRQGKVLYLGVSEWRPDQIEAAAALARELGVQLISDQPQYSKLWRVIEEEVLPTCARLGLGQIVFSPVAQGGRPAPAPDRRRARPDARPARRGLGAAESGRHKRRHRRLPPRATMRERRRRGPPARRRLDAATMAAVDAAFVDETHGDLVERDTSKIAGPFDVMPAWKT